MRHPLGITLSFQLFPEFVLENHLVNAKNLGLFRKQLYRHRLAEKSLDTFDTQPYSLSFCQKQPQYQCQPGKRVKEPVWRKKQVNRGLDSRETGRVTKQETLSKHYQDQPYDLARSVKCLDTRSGTFAQMADNV